MKNLLLVLLLIVGNLTFTYATDYYTSGNSTKWNSDSAWTCNCVPNLSDNNTSIIYINHEITESNLNISGNPTERKFVLNYPLYITNLTIQGDNVIFEGDSSLSFNNLKIDGGSSPIFNVTTTVKNINLDYNSTILGSGSISWSSNLTIKNGSSLGGLGGDGCYDHNSPTGDIPNPLDLSDCTPLPIELLYFDVSYNNSNILFEWATESEVNNDYFTIEKSLDGVEWSYVASLDGANTSYTYLDYEYEYLESLEVVTYFRLKQTDYDGQYAYSDITYLTPENIIDSNISMYIYNNTLNIINNTDQNLKFDLYSVRGELIDEGVILTSNHTIEFSTDVMLILRVYNDEVNKIFKIN